MKLPWREAIRVQPRPVDRKQLDLEAAKEILSEVFQIRPTEVDEMLLEWLEERSGHREHPDGLWPATFCVGD